jgi:hypothetical protein
MGQRRNVTHRPPLEVAQQGRQQGLPLVVHGLHQAERLLLRRRLLGLRWLLLAAAGGLRQGRLRVGEAPLHAPQELVVVADAVGVCVVSK